MRVNFVMDRDGNKKYIQNFGGETLQLKKREEDESILW
jgi:hypothetical protein